MTKIKKLPQNLINLIAAGEVVERPASALKELLENAIDAGSDKIIVRIGQAGLEYIEVSDNGSGMNQEDAKMAFEQHATSKISTEEDLNNIVTLGFRGEALASIASVCQKMTIESKSKEKSATQISQVSGESILEKSTRTEQGTSVRIEGLFSNIPARKKFLKSEQVEFKHLAQTFINTALPSLKIHFELWHNNKEIYKLTKVEDFKDRIFEIWGNNISKHIFDKVEYSTTGLRISAYLGSTEIGRKSGDIQYIFVNNRCINNRTIYQAAAEGYRGFLHRELKPTYFYFLEVDPAEVDVNIHPRKNEVRFNNSQQIFQAIYTITKKTLENRTKSLIMDTIHTNKNQNENLYKYEKVNNSFSTDTHVSKPIDHSNSSGSTASASYNLRANSKPTVQDALSFTKMLIESREDKSQTNADNTNHGINFYQDSFTDKIIPTQLFNTYIVFERENKLIFVDQHAAAEKITFEKLYKNYGSIKTKPMLIPEIINLKKHEKEEVLSRKEELSKSGIVIEDFGGDTIQISEIPEIIDRLDIHYYIQEILNPGNEFAKAFNKEEYNNLTYEAYILLATEACHGSIRAGQKLTSDEMKRILQDLLSLKNPYNCPHGRPVMWELEREGLEKNFKRRL